MMKKTMIGAMVTAAVLTAAAGEWSFPRTTPESQGIRSEAVIDLIDRLEKKNADWPHAYMLIRHGKVVAEGWWAPYDAATRHQLYSVSKGFVSLAIGYAVEDRKLTLNDRVNWFFPWYVPPEQDERASEIRVRDLLAMSSGQAQDAAGAMLDAQRGMVPRAFFSVPMAERPGLYFNYHNGNTMMLAEIHRRVTGEADMLRYLKPRLFDPLGITDYEWSRMKDGTVVGSMGLELRAEDLAKVAYLTLRNGVWQGERLIPLWWIKQATSCQTRQGNVIANDPILALHVGADGWEDWEVGYGYQLWMGRHDTYRFCGAFGQVAVVMPEKDLVFVAFSGGGGANSTAVNSFYDAILPGLSDEALADNPAACAKLEKRNAALSLRKPAGGAKPTAAAKSVAAKGETHPEKFVDKEAEEEFSTTTLLGKLGWKRWRYDETTGTFAFENAFGLQEFTVGRGEWTKGEVEFEREEPRRLDRVGGGKQPVAACGGWEMPTVFRFRLVFPRSPFHIDFTIDCAGAEPVMESKCELTARYRWPEKR